MDAQDPAGIRALMQLGKEVALLLEEAPVPTLAVVNGYALGGGCELSLACDLVLASENAQFGLPEVDLAVLPGWGGSQRLERRVGYGRARELLFTGRRVPATEALAWGLCNHVYPLAELRERAADLARTIAGKDAGSVAAAKRALRLRGVLSSDEGLARETELFVELFDRPERRAAMSRFLQR
jgi:enoyl-CoA hydratase